MTRRAIAYLPGEDPTAPSPPRALAGAAPQGVEIVGVLDGAPGADGAGELGEALGRIAAGEASTLLVARLGDAATSTGELLALLDWMQSAGADLIALDVGLDTASGAGAQAMVVLRALERWRREPHPRRAPRGRPALSRRAPELAERMNEMRRAGMSLRAIADTLNAEGVPTHRGGARWRASSVQAALGYRRPGPPPPGIKRPGGHAPRTGPAGPGEPHGPAGPPPPPPPPRGGTA